MSNAMFDRKLEYGVVLEGGGAKGAYQIGVWKALIKNNIKIKGVAGVSVGALNAALIAMGNYELAENIWTNIKYSTIMDVNDKIMHNIINKNIKDLKLQNLREDGMRILLDGGFDALPLKTLISDNIDEKAIRESGIELVLGTFSLSELKEVELSLDDIEEGKLVDFLMASASFPLFKREKVDGKTYIDGGVSNNLPIDMLIKRGYKNIIVIRIHGIGIEKRVKIPDDVNLIEIEPDVDLGYVLQFDKNKANKNIQIGYYDCLRVIHSLIGRFYYIEDIILSEECFLKEFIEIDDELLKKMIEFYKLSSVNKNKIRILIEDIYPMIATGLKLHKEWSYKDLYIALLEAYAKRLRIKRYEVYSIEALKREMAFKTDTKIRSKDFDLVIELGKHLILR